MNTVVLSLGSNVGDRLLNLQTGIARLNESACRIIKKSAVYRTAPWGNPDQRDFYNVVVHAETELPPLVLLDTILSIEKESGRIRDRKWEPRTLDIDILFYEDRVMNGQELTLPHPHLHERKFVLEPLAEILPELQHPVLGKSVLTLLAEAGDKGRVEKLSAREQPTSC